MTLAPLSDVWVEAVVAASAQREAIRGLDGIVTLAIGKTTKVTLDIASGRVTGRVDAAGEVEVPFTKAQLAAWADGEFDLSVAYMKGDLKPTGATGPFLALLAVMDDPAVVSAV